MWGVVFALYGVVMLLGAAAGADGTFHDRLERLDALISASPQSAELYLSRAELHRSNLDHTRALTDIERAAALAPERRDLDFLRGRIYLEAGQPERAEPLLQRFLDREPSHPLARLSHARALAALGRHLEAADEFTRGIDVMPSPSPDHFRERARALAAAGPEHLETAIQGLDEGVTLLGPVVTLELDAVDFEVELGRIDEALARVDRIAARAARKESWLARRGAILESAGRREEATASFEQVLRELEQLSAARRRTPAMRRLNREVHEALARLERSHAGVTEK